MFKRNLDDKSSEQLFEKKIFNGSLLDTKMAAFFLSISPNALRILVYRGKVKAYKLGSRLRFKMSDLLLALSKKGA